MRRNLAAPVLLCLALAAGCGGTSQWSSTGPAPAAPGAVGTANPVVRPPHRKAREIAPTTAPKPARKVSATTSRSPLPAHARTTTPVSTHPTSPTSPAIDPISHSAGAEQGWVAYRDASGVTLLRPTSWTVQSGPLGPLAVSIDGAGVDSAGYRRNVNLLEQPLADGLTVDAYGRATLKRMAQTGGRIDDDRAATLGGAPGRQVVWHVTKAGKTQSFLSVWAVRGHVVFLVTYSSDQHNFATPLLDVRRLIASIHLPPAA